MSIETTQPWQSDSARPLSAVLRDIVSLAKPRITLMVVLTAAGGMWLAPQSLDAWTAMLMLVTTATVVASANALNCWLERDSDRLMARTRTRPLPDRRLAPNIALWFGVSLGLISVPVLTFFVNPLTGLLGAIALISYVAVYTPMKRISSVSLLVGAVPGALPPLMGWTAATNSLDAPGLVLFAILFLWQVPHFIAIAIYRQNEYEKAGLITLPTSHGLPAAKRQAVFYTGALLISSVLLFVFRTAGMFYLGTALLLGGVMLVMAIRGLREDAGPKWARKLFVTSLIYLTGLFFAFPIDAALG